MPVVRNRSRVGNTCVFVAWLVALAACSSAAPAGTAALTAGAPTAGVSSTTSSGRGLATPTLGPGDGSAPSGSPGQGPIASATAPPSTRPPGPAPVVTLNGPFGSVDGDPSRPAVEWPDASGLQGLDTYVHSAPLSLTLVDPDLTFAAWSISVTSAVSPTADAALGAKPYPATNPDLLRITGPPSGDWLLRADLTSVDREPASYFWRLTVPDRDPPADGHVVVPAPRARLAAAGATVTGVPGSGCYVDTCSDVGHTPPAGDLEQLAATPGGMLSLTLSDGSRIVHWNVSSRPVHGSTAALETLDRGRNPAGVDHATFAAPGSGLWYVTISVTFDRRRGSYAWYTLLAIP